MSTPVQPYEMYEIRNGAVGVYTASRGSPSVLPQSLNDLDLLSPTLPLLPSDGSAFTGTRVRDLQVYTWAKALLESLTVPGRPPPRICRT
jgi:hypothetical protein